MLERFEEALHDPAARLTYSALSGMYTTKCFLLLTRLQVFGNNQ